MHIFISYAKRDTNELARELFSALNALEGITAWMDESLQPTTPWDEQLEQEILRADYVLVLLSPDVNRKKTENQARSFVLREISFAQEQHKSIFLVMADKTEVPLILHGEQYLDLAKEGKEPILDFFSKELGKDGKTSPKPSPVAKLIAPAKRFKLTNETAMILAAVITGIFSLIAVLISQNLGTAQQASPTATRSQTSSTAVSQATLAFMGDEGIFDINLLYDGDDAITIQAAAASDLRALVLVASDTSYPLSDYFPDVIAQPMAAGDCLRLYRDGGDIPPAPRACRGSTFEVGLSNTEIFWFDSLQNQPVNIRLVMNSNSLGLCSATMALCHFTQDGMQ